jgi:hypothetical protein
MIEPNKLLVETSYNLDHPANAGMDTSQGVMVENEAAPPEPKPGKGYLWYVNPQTGEQWFEEYDRPLTAEEQMQVQQQQLDDMTVLLGDLLLGGVQ